MSLEQTRDLLDQYMNEVMRQSLLLMSEPLIDDFLNLPALERGSPNIQTVIESSSLLHSYETLSSFISEVYIYSGTNNYLLSSSNAYLDMEKVYESTIAFEGYSYRQWHHSILKEKHNNNFLPVLQAKIDGRSASVIPFLRSLPLDYPFINSGKIILLLNEKMIRRMLENLRAGPNSQTLIVDYNGQILVSAGNRSVNDISIHPDLIPGTGEKIALSGEDYLVFSTQTNHYGWTIISLLSQKELKNQSSSVWPVYALLSFFLFLCLAGYSLYIILIELKNRNQLRNPAAGFNDKEYREDLPDTLKDNEICCENPVDEERNRLFLHRLFSGSFSNRQDFVEMAKSLRLSPSEGPYTVVSVKLKGQDAARISDKSIGDILFTRKLLQNIPSDLLNSQHMIFQESSQLYSILIWGSREDPESAVQVFYQLLSSAAPVDLFMGTGSQKNELHEVHTSYRESRTALKFLLENQEPGQCHISRIPQNNETWHYPVDTENQIINRVLGGDVQGSFMLDQVITENLTDKKLSPSVREGFFHALEGTVHRIRSRIPYNFEPPEFRSLENPAEKEIRNAFKECCRIIEEINQSRDEQLSSRLLQLVKERYSDPSLTLYTLAAELGQRESTLYYLFNHHYQMSFARYLEKIRLDTSVRLIKDNRNYSICDIALKVGYSNTQTFRRAFKKRMGVTPSVYRDRG